jgi:hypothetical protein
MTVGNQATEKVNPKINGTALTRMFNLNIFELVNNGQWFSLIIGIASNPCAARDTTIFALNH